MSTAETFLINIGPATKCKFCSALIAWGLTPEGRKLPVYWQARTDGMLTVDANGRLIRAERKTPIERFFRSHLLDCKPLRDALFKRTRINIGGAGIPCDWPGCDLLTQHAHCFKCGSLEHFAKYCEEETDDES